MAVLSMTQLLTLLACGTAAVYSLVQIGMAVRARRWPSVEGEIASARMVRVAASDGTDLQEYVAYRYTVAGRPYRNDRLRFGPQVAAPSPVPQFDREPNTPSAQAALERQYPRNQRVRVYYNPDRPEESVLHLAPSVWVWVILVTAGIFAYATLFGHS
jgi:hypothetical protein